MTLATSHAVSNPRTTLATLLDVGNLRHRWTAHALARVAPTLIAADLTSDMLGTVHGQ